MRRFLLIFTVLSVSGWSQRPAQQPAQAPIVVKVEMPPESIWTSLLKVAIPTVLGAGLGAGITLYGVWLTNKRNAAENAANREHALNIERIKDEIAAEARSRDNRWEFRKDVYSDLIRTTCNLLTLFNESLAINQTYLSNPTEAQFEQDFKDQLTAFHPRMRAAVVEYFILSNLSHLATADWLSQRFVKLSPMLNPSIKLASPEFTTTIVAAIDELNATLKTLCEAGRKDLWDTPEPEAKDEAGT